MNGIIYVAAGAGYYDLAVQSALSAKSYNPDIEIDIFTDQDRSDEVFSRRHPIPSGPTPKLASLPHSRFDRTLYLDCDTLIIADFGDLFDILDRFDVAVTHDVRRSSNLIRSGHEFDTPYAFPQMNGGVILYSASDAARTFLMEWQEGYRRADVKRDQVSLRDTLWGSALRFYVLPPEFNLRRVTMLDAWEPLDARPTIVHSHRLLQHLRGDEGRISTLERIVAAEREALCEEWRQRRDAMPQEDFDDLVRRFHAAERLEREPEPVREGTGNLQTTSKDAQGGEYYLAQSG